MNKISIKKIKDLRKKTEASVAFCREALEESKGDEKKALECLRKRGAEIASKRQEKEAEEGIIEAYIHNNKKVGALVELLCETDFVAKNEEFRNLAHEIAMHITAMDPKDIKDLLGQPFIKDEAIIIQDFIDEKVAKLGERIKVNRFIRYEIGKK